MRSPAGPQQVGLLCAVISLLGIVASGVSFIPKGFTAIPTAQQLNAAAAARWQQHPHSAAGNVVGAPSSGGPVRRIFVVGSAHSGTSLLLRSIGNMRGVRCLKKETELFVKNTEGDERLKTVLTDWDAVARQGEYLAWVEATPRHIHYISKMLELDPLRNNTRVIFIHRDGRYVAKSLKDRGYSWDKAVDRWLEDTSAVLPFLDSGVALAVGFERLTSPAGVLRVLRRVADFLELPVTDGELGLALLPGTRQRRLGEYCTPYINDGEKLLDLSKALVNMLSGKPLPDVQQISTAEVGEEKMEHIAWRTKQMAQAWVPVKPEHHRTWITWEEERLFFSRSEVRELMKRFGYTDGMSGSQ